MIQKFSRETAYSHGYPFVISRNQFGYNVTHEGNWLWRAKTKGEAMKVIRKFGIKYMRDSLNAVH